MFNQKKSWGDHKIFNYDTGKHLFIEYFQNLFQTVNLDELHLKSTDYERYKDRLSLGVMNDR